MKKKERVFCMHCISESKNMGTRNYKSWYRRRKRLAACNKKRAWLYKLRNQNTKNMERDDLRLLEMGTETSQEVSDGQTQDST